MTNQRYYVIPTNELRWYGDPLSSAEPARLQQKWMQYPLNDEGVPIEAGASIKWRDVPFVEEESEDE